MAPIGVLARAALRQVGYLTHQWQYGFWTWLRVQYQIWLLLVLDETLRRGRPRPVPPRPVDLHGIRKKLVLVGGGHAHVHVIQTIAQSWRHHLDIVVLSNTPHLCYSGRFPACIAGRHPLPACTLDLHALCQQAHIPFLTGTAFSLDRTTRRLHYHDPHHRPHVLSYDLLSLNIGSQPDMPPAAHASPRVFCFKPLLTEFWTAWQTWQDTLWALPHRPMQLVVVGGGATGTEMALALHAHLSREAVRRGHVLEEVVAIHLVTSSSTVLPGHALEAQRLMTTCLRVRRIVVHTNTPVHDLALVGLDVDYWFWCTRARAAAWLGTSGLAVDAQGCVRVQASLQTQKDPCVFAVGDCATLPDPCPKAGVFAVRQSKILVENLARAVQQRPLVAFAGQKEFLSLIGTGGNDCIASKAEMALQAPWIGRLKDAIDGAWLDQYQHTGKRD